MLEDLQQRLKAFGLRIVRLYAYLPQSPEAQVIGQQLLLSGTGAGARCREAQRRSSLGDTITKIEVAIQELEATAYWQELLVEANIVESEKLSSLRKETEELLDILSDRLKELKSQIQD